MGYGTKHDLLSRRGVRVVGKIGSFLDLEMIGSPNRLSSSCSDSKISVSRIDGDHASISFGEIDQFASRKESYDLDWCYEEDEDAGEIFLKEVMPFLEGIFHGSNACVIAYGARGSGKTRLIRGSEESPGLAPMAVSEILTVAEEKGGSVSVSFYEMCGDHIYDLLEPKEHEVQVLEDAARKIQLKGLSQVPVKSISEFGKLYFDTCTQQKSSQKVSSDITRRSHKGLILYVSGFDKENKGILLGKISFLDLAGYEDAKHLSIAKRCSTESAKVNKSLFQLLNVVHALNAKETYIPYRESKLTRLLQDFLCGSNGAVLITCLNSALCQDAIHALSMASRSCQVISKQGASAKKSKSIPRFVPSCSPSQSRNPKVDLLVKRNETSLVSQVQKKTLGTLSAINERNQPLCTSAKKSGISQIGSSRKKRNDPPSIAKGRKLFDITSPVTSSVQENTVVFTTVTEASILDEEASVSRHNDNIEPQIQEVVVSPGSKNENPQATKSGLENEIELSAELDGCTIAESQDSRITMGEFSPPLSERLREISNSLKLLSSQPSSLTTPQRDTQQSGTDQMEAKTPGIPLHLSLDDRVRNENIGTPQDLFRTRSIGLKTSLVQECLAFLNTADKEELKALKGIGEKRASHIVELRETEAEPFKEVEDLKALGLSSKQIREMVTKALGDF